MSVSERSSRNKAHRYALTLPEPEAAGHRQPGFALFLLAVVLFIAARLWRLGAFGLWGDEITSLEVVRLAWSGLFAFIKADVVHPPLFYVLLKLWVGIGGDSLAWLRLFPVLTAIATIVPFYLLGRELNIPIGQMGLALLLAAVNGYLVYYGQELRMYGLMLFLTVCSLWWFARFVNSARWVNLVVLSAVNLLLVYTHYFGWLVVGVEFIFLMFRGGRPFYQFAAATAVLVVCFSPWLYVAAQAAVEKGGLNTNLGWLRRPTRRDLIWPYVLLNGPLPSHWPARASLLGILLFGYPVALWMLHALKARWDDVNGKPVLWWLVSLCGLPVAIVWAISQVSQPLWHPRYFIIIAVPYFILVGIALGRLRPLRLRALTTLLAVGWATLSAVREVQNSDRIPWHSLVAQMIEAEGASNRDVTLYTFRSYGIQFHLDEAGEKRFHVERAPDHQDPRSWGDRFWISYRVNGDRYRAAFSDAPRWEEQNVNELKQRFRVMGYRMGKGFVAGSPGYRNYLFPVWR